MNDKRHRLRQLPSVDHLLSRPALQDAIEQYNRQLLTEAIRAELEHCRQSILNDQSRDCGEEALLHRITRALHAQFKPSLRPVINATGVLIHTNLGRVLLSDAAQKAMLAVANAYSTLEYDLNDGARGSRFSHASQLLRDLTGAEDSLALNNNASALILILSALAKDREVIISRGQLLEIGGGFRIPDILQESGAILTEVGTTNRTRITDCAKAINDRSAMILRVHASNFKQIGFVEQPTLHEITDCATSKGLLAVDDLGSGTLLDTTDFGLAYEPTIQDSVRAGFDLICFSGDKLLGGPQAGIIVGKANLIRALKRHPLARAFRVDKLTYAALIATLQHYRRGQAETHIPVWRMIARSQDDIKHTAQRWRTVVGGEVVPGHSTVGGGSLPGETLPTSLLALSPPSPERFLTQLRAADTPVIARASAGKVLLDPRTVLPHQEPDLLNSLASLLSD